MRRMGEARAWRHIAANVEQAERIDYGLCWEVRELWCESAISDRTRAAMDRRVYAYLPRFESWAGPHGEWKWRVLAACWLALEAEEEG